MHYSRDLRRENERSHGMRIKIGVFLLALIVPYTIYACNATDASPPFIGIIALAIAGGIMIRRGREARIPPRPMPVPTPVAIPAAPKPPSFAPPEQRPAAPPPEETWKEGDVIRPPPPDKRTGERPVLRLVWTDGKRADVRDYRRKAAK